MIVLYRCFRLVLLVALVSLLLIVFSVLVTPYRTLSLRICALTSRIRHTSSDITCSRNPLVSGSSDVLNKSVNKVAIKNQILVETTSVYVVSLKRRIDRRERMERLRNALGLNWIYFPALDRENIIIDKILAFVIRQRATFNVEFQWPQKLERPILLASSFLNELDLSLRAVNVDTATTDDLLCATENNTIPTYANASSVPFHMRLSRGMLACWYSHLQLIVTIVNNTQHIRDVNWDGKDGITIVFEDDVDVEWDLADRLARMWDDLPRDWDIIMLGASFPFDCLYQSKIKMNTFQVTAGPTNPSTLLYPHTPPSTLQTILSAPTDTYSPHRARGSFFYTSHIHRLRSRARSTRRSRSSSVQGLLKHIASCPALLFSGEAATNLETRIFGMKEV